jgi:hypothetical protein
MDHPGHRTDIGGPYSASETVPSTLHLPHCLAFGKLTAHRLHSVFPKDPGNR